ncbi:hypothetical protein OPKNFCMD_6618 [Methylobacterium crusticola]|uniref:Low affinity iron permease family protein n=1 Tax=Methylobacterium crusticola TaxID=1697972 RepID=A0ABQ4RAM8_9HYPH|nr:low affinity iron permease family protein [Methylobacterium crusticola]GJD53839.1 hypothetical protein OPKNFCMD_6618 [Methylobacterium crusticola]
MSPAKLFTAFASAVARAAGKPATFATGVAAIGLWAVTGPLFHYSDTWQLIINTGTTIVTFLMVFLIQNTQNRDGAAIQAKLDELIRTSAAQDRYIGIESLTEEELGDLRTRCVGRAERARLGEASDEAAEMADRRARAAARQASGLPSYPGSEQAPLAP